MKLNKIVLGALALLAGSSLAAQTVSLHGYLDYTNFGLGQAFNTSSATDSWTYTEPSAEFGSFYNGRTELNMNVTAANFQFNTGVRLDASGGTWYNLYNVVGMANSDGDGWQTTPVYQMNIKAQFFNQQLAVYTGKFEEWNNGYIYNGYYFGGQFVRNLADRDLGQHFTGIEWTPHQITGLRMMVGVPIIPGWGNGLQYSESNQWDNLCKKAMFMFSYKWMQQNITFNGGFRPGTYYTGKYYYYDKDGSTTNYFGEGFIQADLPTLFSGVRLNTTYDIRYRKNETVDTYTTLHYFGVSGTTSPIPNFNINFEDRIVYADDHYVATNEKLLYNNLGLGLSYNIPGKSYVIGFNTNFAYAQDANGTAYSGGDGQISVGTSDGANWNDDYAITSDWMTSAASAGYGAPGRYIGVYAYPYFQKNFNNGYAKIGIELQYTNFHVTQTTQNLTYRVPVALCFWF
jgi:hypothetical protein